MKKVFLISIVFIAIILSFAFANNCYAAIELPKLDFDFDIKIDIKKIKSASCKE